MNRSSGSYRSLLLNDIQSIEAVTDDKRILKHIMIDILNLRNGMEDNLLLIQQINLMTQKEGEEQKGFDDVIHAAQQHIDSINTVYTLGVSWLKDETEFALKFIEDGSRDCDQEHYLEEINTEIQDRDYINQIKNMQSIKNKINLKNIHNKINMENIMVTKHSMEGTEKSENIEVCESLNSKEEIFLEIRENMENVEIMGKKENKEIENLEKMENIENLREIRNLDNGKIDIEECEDIKVEMEDCEVENTESCIKKDELCKTESFLQDFEDRRRHLASRVEGRKRRGNSNVVKNIYPLAIKSPCDQCSYVAYSKTDLTVHLRRTHSEGMTCDLCDFVGSTTGLREHKRRKHEGYYYYCRACDFKDLSNDVLKNHIKEKHDGRGFACNLCSKGFHIRANLDRHVRNVHKREIYTCDKCEYSAKSSSSLKEHNDSVHLGRLYNCDKCDYVASKPSQLRNHKSRHVTEEDGDKLRSFMCDQCDYVASSFNVFKAHIKNKHDKSTKYSCDKCKYSTFNKLNWTAHKNRHNSAMVLCDQCPYVGKPISLKVHVQVHHDKVNFPCNLCSYSGQSETHLRLHTESVHMGIKYFCDICGFAASTTTNLKQHKDCKHDDTKYPCDKCGYLASTKYLLRKHIKKKHSCPVNTKNTPSVKD